MKKVLIIIVVLVLIIGALYFLIWRARPVVKPVEPSPQPVEAGAEQGGAVDSTQPVIDSVVLLQQELKNRARVFIERYGSYSSDANFANLEDLIPMMSESLANETKNYIAAQRAKEKVGQIFYSSTTRVLSIKFEDFIPDVSAVFTALCQQQETKDKTTNMVYKTVKLKMVFENNGWLIDSIIIQ